MNRYVTLLLLVLLIQCGIATAVFWPQPGPATGQGDIPLATFSATEVDEIRIGDEFDNEAVLLRSGGLWRVPAMENLPADSAMVEALLEGIAGQSVHWPIGVSAAARQRFKVTNHRYNKRLAFFGGGSKLDTIFLGSSPGFRKVHARNDNQDAVYGITFNAFDAPAVDDAWLDPTLLQVRSAVRLDADLYSLNYGSGSWLSGTGHAPDEAELSKLLTTLKTLQTIGVADQNTQRELSEIEADLVLNVTSLAGDVSFELFTVDGEHYIQSSEYPLFFKLRSEDFERLLGIDVPLITGERVGSDSGGDVSM